MNCNEQKLLAFLYRDKYDNGCFMGGIENFTFVHGKLTKKWINVLVLLLRKSSFLHLKK